MKTGLNDNGPAWIGRVSFSKTGQTIYYREKSLRRIHGGGVQGNQRDVKTGEEYWVSGVQRNQEDRHWPGLALLRSTATWKTNTAARITGISKTDLARPS